MQTPDSISSGPRGMLILGRCRFEGIFDCPCPEGSAYELVKELNHDLPCNRCGHKLGLHQDHEGESAPFTLSAPPRLKIEHSTPISNSQSLDLQQPLPPSPPAPPLLQSSPSGDTTILAPEDQIATEIPVLICERQETVSQIVGMLDEYRSVFIWGMSGSGKTTLAYLLFEHLSRNLQKVVLVENWPENQKKRPEEVLLEYIQLKFPDDISGDRVLGQDFIFLIDEAQETLRKQKSQWNSLIKSSNDPKKQGPRFCLFSEQGMIAHPNDVFATMAEISYLNSHGNGNGNASLFFTMSEFKDLAQQICVRSRLLLSKEALVHIFWLTGGHPLLSQLILEYVKLNYDRTTATPFSSTLRYEIPRSAIQAVLHNDDDLFKYLETHIYPGHFARSNSIAVNIFKRLLNAPERKISWNAKYTTIGKCFTNGLICHEIDGNDVDVFRFPSPLHERWAQWYHKIEPGVYAGELTP